MYEVLFRQLAELTHKSAPLKAIADEIAASVKAFKAGLEILKADELAELKDLTTGINAVEQALDTLALEDWRATSNTRPHTGITVRLVPTISVSDPVAVAGWIAAQDDPSIWQGVISVDAAAFARLIEKHSGADQPPPLPPAEFIVHGQKPVPAISHKYVDGIRTALYPPAPEPPAGASEMIDPPARSDDPYDDIPPRSVFETC